MARPTRRAAPMGVSRPAPSTPTPAPPPLTSGPTQLALAADHVDRIENRNQVRDGVALDEPRQRAEDGEARSAHLHRVRLAGAVGDEVEAQLAVAALGVDVDLAWGHVDAFHDQLEVR